MGEADDVLPGSMKITAMGTSFCMQPPSCCTTVPLCFTGQAQRRPSVDCGEHLDCISAVKSESEVITRNGAHLHSDRFPHPFHQQWHTRWCHQQHHLECTDGAVLRHVRTRKCIVPHPQSIPSLHISVTMEAEMSSRSRAYTGRKIRKTDKTLTQGAVKSTETRLAPAGAVDARPASLRRIWPSSNNIMISYDCTSSKKLNFSHFF